MIHLPAHASGELAVAAQPRAHLGESAQLARQGLAPVEGEVRKAVAQVLERELAAFGDAHRVRERLGQIAEALHHLGLRAQVSFGVR